MPDKVAINKKKNSTYHEMRRGLAILVLFSPVIVFAFVVLSVYLWNRVTRSVIYLYNNDSVVVVLGLIMLLLLVLFLRRLRYVVSWRRGLFAELRRTAHIREDYLMEQDDSLSSDNASDALDDFIESPQQQTQR